MRMGLIGPATDAMAELGRALELLLSDPEVARIVYLGDDDAVDEIGASTIEAGVAGNGRAVGGSLAGGRSRLGKAEFLSRAADLACSGSSDAIAELLSDERAAKHFHRVRKLPDPPARAVEMMDKWIVLGVHDKAVLDEDDIANAHIIVYGRSDEAGLKRFGPRCFFTPGPLRAQRFGYLDLRDEGHIEVRLLDLDGKTVFCETLHGSGAKLVVSS
jgi:hypothetical protein